MWCIKAWNAPVNQGTIDVAALAKEVERLKSAVPIGAVLAFPTGIVAPGYLELDGSVQSIATYPDLAAYLGTTYNKGNEGAGNFRLPESRGEFLRGWDHGRGADPGRTIGSWQKGSIAAIDTNIPATQTIASNLADYEASRIRTGYDSGDPALYAGVTLMGVNPQANFPLPGGPEVTYGITRPNNLAVMWCIKAWNAPINQGSIDIAALAADIKSWRLNGSEVGATRNLRVSLPSAASVATLTADQLIVEQPGIGQYKLSSVNLSIDLTTIGAGGMDVGVAPALGSVGIYVIYNPVLRIAKLLGVNASSALIPEVYSGAYMPAGYTASALVSVWQTDTNRLMVTGVQHQRLISIPRAQVLSNGASLTWTPVSLASIVPKNAKSVGGYVHYISSAESAGGGYLGLASDAVGTGLKTVGIGGMLGLGVLGSFSDLVMTTPQTIHYILDSILSRANSVHISQYTF
jgi:microcystin-dependent protein